MTNGHVIKDMRKKILLVYSILISGCMYAANISINVKDVEYEKGETILGQVYQIVNKEDHTSKYVVVEEDEEFGDSDIPDLEDTYYIQNFYEESFEIPNIPVVKTVNKVSKKITPKRVVSTPKEKKSMSFDTSGSTIKKKQVVKQEPVMSVQDNFNNIDTVNVGKLLNIANKYLGVRYLWGGETFRGLDCSALVRNIYRELGFNLPRVSRYQAKVGKTVSLNGLKVGDLLFFKTDKKRPGVVSHVGMYVGNGKMIHASSMNKKVVIVNINGGYFMKRLSHIKRIANI